MKRKGFTLIELLAVIVILAIIAVIAVPIVIDIIEDAKVESTKRSVQNYIHAAELFISQAAMNGNNLSDGYYKVESLDIKVDGMIPDYGYIKIKDGDIVGYNLNIDNKNYTNKTNGIEETLLNPLQEYSELSIDYVNQSVIKGISFFYNDSFGFNIYVDKNSMENIKNIYLKVEFDDRCNEISSGTYNITSYKKLDKYYVFSFENIWILEFANNINIQIIDKSKSDMPLDSIDYSVSKYAQNIVYKTKNSYEKNILISLMNLGTASQIKFEYNIHNLANAILNVEDKNIDILTKNGEEIIKNSYNLDENVINTTDEQFASIGAFDLTSFGLAYRDGFYYQIRLGKKVDSTGISLTKENTTEEEFNKYGVLVFTNDVFNTINDATNNYSNLNINTPGVIDIKGEYNISPHLSPYPTFTYKYDIKKLNEPTYFRVYYKINENEYIYSKLQVKSIISDCSKYISDDKTSEVSNTYKSTVNFIGLL